MASRRRSIEERMFFDKAPRAFRNERTPSARRRGTCINVRVGRPSSATRRKPNRARLPKPSASQEPELTRKQARELERRVEDLHDPTRYLLKSALTSGIVLYYNLSEDTYGWNDPSNATLFKRRDSASAIQALLGEGVRVARCRVDRKGQVVKRSLEAGPSKARARS